MNVSKNKVAILGAAIAAMFAVSAQAVVNLDSPTVLPSIVPTYASEIVTSPAVNVPNVGASLDVTAKLGFGLAAAQDRFFRFDLTGATFGALVTSPMLTNVPALGTVTVVNGGAIGSNFVIFQATGAGQLATDTFNFAIPGIKFTSTAAPVTINYRLFQDAAAANGIGGVPITNDGRLLVSKTSNLVQFTSAISTTFQPARTEFLAATTGFTRFCDGGAGAPGTAGCTGAATDTIAVVGTIATHTLATGTILNALSLPIVALSEVLLGTSTATLRTNAPGFQVGSTAGTTLNTFNCAVLGAVPGTVTPALAPTVLTYPTGNNMLVSATSLCYNVSGAVGAAIVEQDITGNFNYLYAAGYTGAPTSTAGVVALFRRDGVELQSPWFTTTTGYISRFFLTNTGAVDAVCNVVTWNAAGAVTPTVATVTVTAGTQRVVPAVDVLPAAPLGPYAVRFVCGAPSSAMQGNYVLTSPNGAVTIGGMIRPATN
jgi:hypothetical protein